MSGKSKIIKDYLLITAGTFLVAFAIKNIYDPMGLVTGGVSGIAIILKEILDVPLWVTNTVMNIPLFLFSVKILGWTFVKRTVYAIMGLLVGCAAVLQVSRIGAMDYANAGSGYEMDAIAAVIVGGTSMAGGRGSISGTILGVLIIAVMNNLLNLIGVPPFLREAFKGFIVIAAVLLQKKEKA